MRKLTDEEWQKVMDQTQGHKVARAIYEAMQKRIKHGIGHIVPSENVEPVTSTFVVPWDQLFPGEREFFIAVAGDLFDNEVIEGGNALPKLYNPARDQES